MKIRRETNLFVRGPCKIKVLSGEVRAQGLNLRGEISLDEGQTMTLYTPSEAQLEMEGCETLTFPDLGWEELASQVISTGGKVVVVGPTDSGKTYFATTLSNLSKDSLILDADVGQNSSFLPTFVSLELRRNGSRELKGLKFFGDITPSSNPRLHVEQVVSMARGNCIVDTDGWLRGFSALRHKLELLESLNPDHVLVFDERLSDFLRPLLGSRVKLVRRAPLNLSRGAKQRRGHRAKAYSSYFSQAKLRVVHSQYLLGHHLGQGLYNAWGEVISIKEEDVCHKWIQGIERTLVGVIKGGEVVGAGILLSVDGEEVRVFTPVDDLDSLILGRVYLDEEWKEGRTLIQRCNPLG